MPWDHDYNTEIDLDGGQGCITAPAVFSTWLGHPDDLPDLKLETVTLGNLRLSREDVCDWLGAHEVARIERAYQPETWNPARLEAAE